MSVNVDYTRKKTEKQGKETNKKEPYTRKTYGTQYIRTHTILHACEILSIELSIRTCVLRVAHDDGRTLSAALPPLLHYTYTRGGVPVPGK